MWCGVVRHRLSLVSGGEERRVELDLGGLDYCPFGGVVTVGEGETG